MAVTSTMEASHISIPPRPNAQLADAVPAQSTRGRGTLACTCTLISARDTRSVCREVANRSVSRQGERVRSSDNSYKIAASRRYQKLAEMYWALALGEKTFYICGRKRRLTNA
jgi:hypothetical protein